MGGSKKRGIVVGDDTGKSGTIIPDKGKPAKNDPEIEAFDKYVLEQLCSTYGIDPSLHDAREELYRRLSESSAPTTPQKKPLNRTKIKRIIWVSPDHYSRLKVQWSDYHRGACSPLKIGESKYFEIDKTVYEVRGEYPDFYVVAKTTFRSTFQLENWMRRKRNA